RRRTVRRLRFRLDKSLGYPSRGRRQRKSSRPQAPEGPSERGKPMFVRKFRGRPAVAGRVPLAPCHRGKLPEDKAVSVLHHHQEDCG
ncbi:MAG: hypothetical protein ACYC3I_26960, partial [Gemmataceae bacterium]